MIDHVLVSPGIRVRDAHVDKTMFNAIGQMVDCTLISNGTCWGSGWDPQQLMLYSDHWASWAVLWQ